MKERRGKIFIVNAVLTNNGDAALVFGLYEALRERGFKSTIYTMHYDKISSAYSDYPMLSDPSGAWIFIKLPFLRRVFIRWKLWTEKNYKESDLILGCPGGYMNSTYGIRNKLLVMCSSWKMGKKTAIYSQSFGPFSEKDSELMRRKQDCMGVLMARDRWSVENLLGCGVSENRIQQTNDAAFLLSNLPSISNPHKVAVSVRDWTADGRDTAVYDKMMIALLEKLVRMGKNVELVSTCQGLPGYVDDSHCARRILSKCDAAVAKRVEVIDHYMSLGELRERLRGYEFTIGTRLHMCVLSMKSGTPALNISYEEKGRAMYDYLGLQEYTLDYNDTEENALKVLDAFTKKLDFIRPHVIGEMDKQHREAHSHLDELLAKLFPTPL